MRLIFHNGQGVDEFNCYFGLSSFYFHFLEVWRVTLWKIIWFSGKGGGEEAVIFEEVFDFERFEFLQVMSPPMLFEQADWVMKILRRDRIRNCFKDDVFVKSWNNCSSIKFLPCSGKNLDKVFCPVFTLCDVSAIWLVQQAKPKPSDFITLRSNGCVTWEVWGGRIKIVTFSAYYWQYVLLQLIIFLLHQNSRFSISHERSFKIHRECCWLVFTSHLTLFLW